jgi:uncharacterized LabA/DUF88 family protein
MARRIILVDGSNIFHGQEGVGWRIDFKKLKDFLNQDSADCIATYYGSRPAKCPPRQMDFLFYLQSIGYRTEIVVLKERDRRVEKGVDAHMVDDLNTIIQEGNVSHVVLVSGDGDMKGTIEKMKTKRPEIEITVASFEKCANLDLRLAAHKFVSLDKVRGNIEKARDLYGGGTPTKPAS